MKSLMEQASSIIKAIEKAWISANKPKEFSVKIFEQEEKNFFGMTTKPAKIGIFFSEKSSPADKYAKNKPEIREHVEQQRMEKAEPTTKRPEHQARPRQQENRQATHPEKAKINSNSIKPQSVPVAKEPKPAKPSSSWNDPIAEAATDWVKKTLSLMGISSFNVNSEVTGKILKLTFSEPLLENPLAEKNLFRSIAHLVMASLRNQYKQEIKDLKIVLLRQQ